MSAETVATNFYDLNYSSFDLKYLQVYFEQLEEFGAIVKIPTFKKTTILPDYNIG